MKLCGALSSAPGAKTMTKLKPIVSQLISRSEAIRASISRPSTETVMRVADLEPHRPRRLDVERDERRPGIIGAATSGRRRSGCPPAGSRE